MSETFYKPLTPQLRADINKSIDSNLAELRSCDNNLLVNMQITAYGAVKNIINTLPSGYPMPMTRQR